MALFHAAPAPLIFLSHGVLLGIPVTLALTTSWLVLVACQSPLASANRLSVTAAERWMVHTDEHPGKQVEFLGAAVFRPLILVRLRYPSGKALYRVVLAADQPPGSFHRLRVYLLNRSMTPRSAG